MTNPFFFEPLSLMGCLVADQRMVYTKHLKYRVQINKRVTSALVGDPAKNDTIFAMDRCFLLTGTFNGCLMIKSGSIKNLLGVVTKYTIWDFEDWAK